MTPRDFGAIGDGVADDTAALQAWINHEAARGAEFLAPGPGTFLVSSPLLVSGLHTPPPPRVTNRDRRHPRRNPIHFEHLTGNQRDALVRIAEDWISEAFTIAPFEDAYYDIFEGLGLDPASFGPGYDIRRPIR